MEFPDEGQIASRCSRLIRTRGKDVRDDDGKEEEEDVLDENEGKEKGEEEEEECDVLRKLPSKHSPGWECGKNYFNHFLPEFIPIC